MFEKTQGLEIENEKSQINGLGGKFLDEYGVPEKVEWFFVIVHKAKEINLLNEISQILQ